MSINCSDIQDILIAFPKLKCTFQQEDIVLLGLIDIDVRVCDSRIINSYNVKITIYSDFPKNLPIIQENENKVPKDYRHINPDKTLCVATETDIRLNLYPDYKLIDWMNKFVIPYFVTYSYFIIYGVFPFGERSHGLIGILEFYKELFKTKDIQSTLHLLAYICNKPYRGHNLCPCGSEKRIRYCHKDIVWLLQKENFIQYLFNDLKLIIDEINRIKGRENLIERKPLYKTK